MPANLPPTYHEAERRFREAGDPEEKVAILREMLAIMPKHKGTDHLQADLRRRISKLRAECKRQRKSGKRPYRFSVPREGAGQVVLLGAPNAGKSSLLAALTRATPEVAPYPFTTRKPMPGMMPYEDIQIQLVDLPPLAPGMTEHWVFNLLRAADLGVLVVDVAGPDPLGDLQGVLEECRRGRVSLIPAAGISSGNGEDVQVAVSDPSDEGAAAVPLEAGSTAAPPPEDEAGHEYLPVILVGTKCEGEGELGALDVVGEMLGESFPRLAVSAQSGEGLDELATRLFRALDIVRVYTKAPGKKPDLNQPFALPRGSTVLDLARMVHREIAETLTLARLWGAARFDGQPVDRNHVLSDRDVVELRAKR